MGAETTQIRISKTMNCRLIRVSKSIGLTKEQLISFILNESLDAAEDDDLPIFPIPIVTHLRKALNKTCQSVEEMVDKKVAAAISEKMVAIDALLGAKLSKKSKAA